MIGENYFLNSILFFTSEFRIKYISVLQTPSLAEWIAQSVTKKGRIRVGADPKLIPHHVWSTWETEFGEKNEENFLLRLCAKLELHTTILFLLVLMFESTFFVGREVQPHSHLGSNEPD